MNNSGLLANTWFRIFDVLNPPEKVIFLYHYLQRV